MPTNLSTFLSSNFEGAQGVQGATGSGAKGAVGAQGVQGAVGPSTIPQNSKTSSYTLLSSDTAKHISITTG